MRKKTLIVAVIGALAAGGIVGGATIAFAQADVIKQRQDNRKETAATMRAIKGVIDAKGDVKTIVPQAAKLKTLEVAFDKMFDGLVVACTSRDRKGFASSGVKASACSCSTGLAVL